MSVRVTDNTTKILNDKKQAASIFLRNVSEEIIRISTPNTPKDTGRMRDDILKSVVGLKGKVKWVKSYAKYQEIKQFKNYTTPGTGPHFAENAVKQVVKLTNSIAKKSGLI